MRFGSLGPACMVLAVMAGTAGADYDVRSTPPPPLREQIHSVQTQHHKSRAARFFSFRSVAAQIDNQVIANLLADTPSRPNDFPLTVLAGEVARCESHTCLVPVTVRVAETLGPIALTFAVANPKGELSDVQHVECASSECVVSMILERGRNTISVGVLDPVAHATGFAVASVNATRVVAERGRTEWF